MEVAMRLPARKREGGPISGWVQGPPFWASVPAAPSLRTLCLAWVRCHAPSRYFLGRLAPRFSAWEQARASLKVCPISRCQNASTGKPPPGPGRHRVLTALSGAVRRWSPAGVKRGQRCWMGWWGGAECPAGVRSAGRARGRGRRALTKRSERG